MFVNACPRFRYQKFSHFMEFETWNFEDINFKSIQIDTFDETVEKAAKSSNSYKLHFGQISWKSQYLVQFFFKNLIFGVKKYKMSYLFQSHGCPMVNYKIWTLFPPNYMVVNILYQILAFTRNTPKNTNCEFIYVKMSLLICLIICINLYTFEVYIFKISAL